MVQQYSDCDFESLLAKYDYNFKRGDIVNGVVCDYESNGAIVDIGSKSAAFVPSYEVASDKNAKVDTNGNVTVYHRTNADAAEALIHSDKFVEDIF